MRAWTIFGALLGVSAFGFAVILVSVGNTEQLASTMSSMTDRSATLLHKCVATLNARSHTTYRSSDFTTTNQTFDLDATVGLIMKSNMSNECGSTGCIFRLCEKRNNAVTVLSFQYAGQQLQVLQSTTNGMHNLKLSGRNKTIFSWDGMNYVPQL